jgi:hypothetical protein
MKYSPYLFLFLFSIMQSCSTCGLRDKVENFVDEAVREDSIRQARIEQIKFEIDSIRNEHFVYEPDLLSGVYMNKDWDKLSDQNLFGLKMVVYEHGDFALISMLPEQQNPLHNKIEVVIGTVHRSTDTGYAYQLIQPDAQGFTNLPNVSYEALYILQTSCEYIVQAIAENPEEEVTVIVYYNDEQYATYFLTISDRKCIIAAWKIYQLQQELLTLEPSSSGWDD